MKLWRRRRDWLPHHVNLARRVVALEADMKRLKQHGHRLPDAIYAGVFTDAPWYGAGFKDESGVK
jgi:hypothetical protein